MCGAYRHQKGNGVQVTSRRTTQLKSHATSRGTTGTHLGTKKNNTSPAPPPPMHHKTGRAARSQNVHHDVN